VNLVDILLPFKLREEVDCNLDDDRDVSLRNFAFLMFITCGLVGCGFNLLSVAKSR
jgi:hypothetical protein